MIKRETIERGNIWILAPKGRRLICHADQFWGLGHAPVPTSSAFFMKNALLATLLEAQFLTGSEE